MVNITRIAIYENGGYKIDLKENKTSKSNFKFIFDIVVPKLLAIRSKCLFEI